jgi:hypothetical protein
LKCFHCRPRSLHASWLHAPATDHTRFGSNSEFERKLHARILAEFQYQRIDIDRSESCVSELLR